jgi:hypothetical protein
VHQKPLLLREVKKNMDKDYEKEWDEYYKRYEQIHRDAILAGKSPYVMMRDEVLKIMPIKKTRGRK